MPEKVVLVGGGAYAFSILDMLRQGKPGHNIAGYIDAKKTSLSLKYLGNDKEFVRSKKYLQKNTLLVMCIGVNIELRRSLFNFFKEEGYRFLTYVHPSAVVSPTARYGEGSLIFPGTILGPGVEIGNDVCIHSNAVIEHRTIVGDHSYISPSVSIAGDCHIGESSFFGISASVADAIFLCSNTTIGAGAVVLESFHKKSITLVGIPARILER